MKIGPLSGKPAAERKRATPRAAQGGPAFSQYLDTAARADLPSAPAAGSLCGADPLLGLQQIESATERHGRARALRRADIILDQLAELQADLLAGAIPASRLQALTKMLQGQRCRVDDPALTALIDEIELRAEVELAKFDAGG